MTEEYPRLVEFLETIFRYAAEPYNLHKAIT